MMAGALAPGTAAAAAPSSMTANTWPLVTVGAVLKLDFTDHSGRGSRYLQDHLVGLQVDEIFVARHGIAGLLVP